MPFKRRPSVVDVTSLLHSKPISKVNECNRLFFTVGEGVGKSSIEIWLKKVPTIESKRFLSNKYLADDDD